jgi:hypothetical protein
VSTFHTLINLEAYERSSEFADYLEQLESSFYQQMLSKFKPADFAASGFKDGNLVINEISNIQSQEATHDQTLQVRIIDPLLWPISL